MTHPNPIRRAAAALAVLLWAGLAAAGAPAALTPPEQVLRDTADRMFSALDTNRAALKADPSKVEALVSEILIPNFDVDYAARLVLARYWRVATPDQQQRFQKAFIAFLTKTYGKAIVGFERDRLKFLPLRGPVDPKRTFVQTEIARAGGAPIPVDYVMRETPNGWKAFDIVIEGISYVRNYQQSFADEIEREGRGDVAKGLDAMIKRLESGAFNAPGDPVAKPAAGKP